MTDRGRTAHVLARGKPRKKTRFNFSPTPSSPTPFGRSRENRQILAVQVSIRTSKTHGVGPKRPDFHTIDVPASCDDDQTLAISEARKESTKIITFGARRLPAVPGGMRVLHAKEWGLKRSFPPSKVCFPWVSKGGGDPGMSSLRARRGMSMLQLLRDNFCCAITLGARAISKKEKTPPL